MKLPRVKAVHKVVYGCGQLLLALFIMVFYAYRLIKYGDIDPCTLSVAIGLCFSGPVFIQRGRRELVEVNRRLRKQKPKPPRPPRPKGAPGEQRPDKERRRKRGNRRKTASAEG